MFTSKQIKILSPFLWRADRPSRHSSLSRFIVAPLLGAGLVMIMASPSQMMSHRSPSQAQESVRAACQAEDPAACEALAATTKKRELAGMLPF